MESRGCNKPNTDHHQHQISLPACPRCGSSNTKFCYYNNYSLTQPRYFCKGCRRYWTKGGSLRNVPIGGGCRKSRRAKSSIISRTLCHNEFTSNSFRELQTNEYDHSVSNNTTTTTIDVGVVYANFLNQKNIDQAESFNNNNVLPSSIDNFSNMHMNQSSSYSGGFIDCHRQILGDENGVYFTYGNNFMMNNFTLPAGEDIVLGNSSGELLWPAAGPDVILPNHSNLDPDQTSSTRINNLELQDGQNLEVLLTENNNNIIMSDQFSTLDIDAVFRS